MAEVVLFHSVLGLRPGVIAAAERLRAAGHTVHTPDLYDGEVFDDLDDGSRKEDALGYQEIARRAREAVAELPAGLVFAGFSLGAVHAEVLAASRAGALGAVLMHGAVPVEGLSGDLLEYNPASSEEMWERVLAFLDRIDARGSDVEGAR
jgi:dienelactone hydrolase